MSDDSQHLGGRLGLLGESDLDESQRGVWDRLMARQVPEAREAGFVARNSAGQFVGPFNAYIRFAGPGGALLDWAQAQVQTHALSPAARQVVMLAVGAVWGASYEIQAHVAGAVAAGVGSGAIEAVLERRDHPGLSDETRVAREVADALLVEHRVDDDLYGAACATLGEAGIAAVAHLVGQYVAISALLIAFDIPAVTDSDIAPSGQGRARPKDS